MNVSSCRQIISQHKITPIIRKKVELKNYIKKLKNWTINNKMDKRDVVAKILQRRSSRNRPENPDKSSIPVTFAFRFLTATQQVPVQRRRERWSRTSDRERPFLFRPFTLILPICILKAVKRCSTRKAFCPAWIINSIPQRIDAWPFQNFTRVVTFLRIVRVCVCVFFFVWECLYRSCAKLRGKRLYFNMFSVCRISYRYPSII